MSSTTLSSGDFFRNWQRVKQAAKEGPVFMSDGGRLTHVLLTIEDYQKLVSTLNIVNMLATPDSADLSLDVPRCQGFSRAADLS